MDSTAQTAAAALIAPKILKNFRLRWVIYGVAAYYGLRYLNKKGIFAKQTDFALNKIDEGIDFAKKQAQSFTH